MYLSETRESYENIPFYEDRTPKKLTKLQRFLKDKNNLKMYNTRFQDKTEDGIPYDPKSPQNKIFIDADMAGRTCGELYGMDKSKLYKCSNLAEDQRETNKKMAKVSSVYTEFSNLVNLPDRIKAVNPDDVATANSLKSEQNAAYYNDIASVYGVKEAMVNKVNKVDKYVPDPNAGISKRAGGFQKALSERNNDLRNSVLSQTQTMDSLRDTQLLNQDLAYSLENNMSKVERNIATKARLIQINNEAARKKSKAIKGILFGFVGIAFIVMAVVGYMTGWLSLRTVMISVISGVVIVILTVYFLQENVVKASLKNMDSAKKFLIKEGDELNESALEWVDDNCDCPDKSKEEKKREKKELKKYQKLIDHLEGKDEDGIWYDDGSGPPQNISMFAFERGMGRSIKSVSEGDNPDINLSFGKDQELISQEKKKLQSIMSKQES